MKRTFGIRVFNNHERGCTCSYCNGDYQIHYGLNIPSNWSSWNAWYVIKYWDRRYIKWTNNWFKIFIKTRYSFMRPAKIVNKALKRIIIQGNQAEYQKLFDNIVKIHTDEFTEDNFYTTKDFLEELLKNSLDKYEKTL